MQFEDDDLDRWLDKALAEHGQATARDGLEQRILANLAGQEKPRASAWKWAVAAGMAIAATVLAFVLLKPESKRAEVGNEVASVAAPRFTVPAQSPKITTLPSARTPLQPPKSLAPAQRKAPLRQGPSGPSAAPKLATFPSQEGNDELAALAARFAQAHPEEAMRLAVEQEEFRQLAADFTSPVSDER